MGTYDKIKKTLAVAFMHDLDNNRPEGKMCLSNGECADIEKAFNEQDWSKLARYLDKYTESEDERIIEEIKFAIMQMPSEREDTKQRCLAYLEKQKEQKVSRLHPEDYPMTPGECIKPVWSEEDQEAYRVALNYFRQIDDGRSSSITRREVAAIHRFLENLIPQPHWKPSEEEMRTLLDAINPYRLLGDGSREILKSLYEELKKL